MRKLTYEKTCKEQLWGKSLLEMSFVDICQLTPRLPECFSCYWIKPYSCSIVYEYWLETIE